MAPSASQKAPAKPDKAKDAKEEKAKAAKAKADKADDDRAKKDAKGPTPDDVMAIGEMRPMLKLAKGGKAISTVVCMSADGEAIIMMHKLMRPKKLRDELLAKVGEIGLEIDKRSMRFGRAAVQENDDTTLRVTVNREPSGSTLERQLRKRVKPAGFAAVILTTDSAVEEDPDEDEEAAPAAKAEPAWPAADAAARDPAPDKAAAAQGAPPFDLVKLQKSRLAWMAARRRVTAEIEALKTAIEEEFDGDPDEAAAHAAMDELDELVLNFDGTLIDKLDDMLNAADDQAREKIGKAVKKVVSGYIAYLKTNQLVAKLEGETPLGVKLSVGSTLLSTLKVLATQLR